MKTIEDITAQIKELSISVDTLTTAFNRRVSAGQYPGTDTATAGILNVINNLTELQIAMILKEKTSL